MLWVAAFVILSLHQALLCKLGPDQLFYVVQIVVCFALSSFTFWGSISYVFVTSHIFMT